MSEHRPDMREAYVIRCVTDNGPRHYMATVSCACQRTKSIRMGKSLPAEIVIQKIERKGWRWRGRHRWECPVCQGDRGIRTSAIFEMPPPKIEPPAPPPPPLPMRVSLPEPQEPEIIDMADLVSRPPRMATLRKVMDLLEQHFDDKEGRYNDGWHDQRIAELVNLGRADVASIRDDAFGPIRAHPEITELRKMLADLSAESERVLGHLSTLGTRIDDVKKRIDLTENKLLGKAA